MKKYDLESLLQQLNYPVDDIRISLLKDFLASEAIFVRMPFADVTFSEFQKYIDSHYPFRNLFDSDFLQSENDTANFFKKFIATDEYNRENKIAEDKTDIYDILRGFRHVWHVSLDDTFKEACAGKRDAWRIIRARLNYGGGLLERDEIILATWMDALVDKLPTQTISPEEIVILGYCLRYKDALPSKHKRTVINKSINEYIALALRTPDPTVTQDSANPIAIGYTYYIDDVDINSLEDSDEDDEVSNRAIEAAINYMRIAATAKIPQSLLTALNACRNSEYINEEEDDYYTQLIQYAKNSPDFQNDGYFLGILFKEEIDKLNRTTSDAQAVDLMNTFYYGIKALQQGNFHVNEGNAFLDFTKSNLVSQRFANIAPAVFNRPSSRAMATRLVLESVMEIRNNIFWGSDAWIDVARGIIRLSNNQDKKNNDSLIFNYHIMLCILSNPDLKTELHPDCQNEFFESVNTRPEEIYALMEKCGDTVNDLIELAHLCNRKIDSFLNYVNKDVSEALGNDAASIVLQYSYKFFQPVNAAAETKEMPDENERYEIRHHNIL